MRASWDHDDHRRTLGPFECGVQEGGGVWRVQAPNMRLKPENREQILLQQHQRQPQRDGPLPDDHAQEAHRAKGLAQPRHCHLVN